MKVLTHPAGVWAGIAIAHALVVLAAGHRQHVLTVDHDNKVPRFFTVEELQHDAVARVAKRVTGQHVMNRGFGSLQRHRHDNAFPGSQTIGFDNDRRAFSRR